MNLDVFKKKGMNLELGKGYEHAFRLVSMSQ